MNDPVYVFLIKRPQDKEAWPTVWRDLKRANNAEWRASEIYKVLLIEHEPVNVPNKKKI